jgi:hypothetical protein
VTRRPVPTVALAPDAPPRSPRSWRPILKSSSRSSPPASTRALTGSPHLLQQWHSLQRQIEFLVHREPHTAAPILVTVAKVLNALDRREVAADALTQVPMLGGLIQQIVLRAPEQVPALAAYMTAMLRPYPLHPHAQE